MNDSDNTAKPRIRKTSRAPYLLLGGAAAFITLFFIATWSRWMPLATVQVVRVITQVRSVTATDVGDKAVPHKSTTHSSEVAFQAAGWIEADPQLTQITALVSGIVQSVAVVDGQSVTKDQEIARLDDADYVLSLRLAAAEYAAAQARLLVAEQQAQLAQTHVTAHDKHHAVAVAIVAEKQDKSKRLNDAASSVSQALISQAQLELVTAQAQLEAIHTQLSIHEQNLREKQAQLKVVAAQVEIAQVKRDQAQLNVDRCIIRSPMNGNLQILYALPGRKQMLGSDNMHSTTVATIYDPAHLQVRVDVALDDAAGLFINQEANITCSALPGTTFRGTVTRLLGVADVGRNTLQAKVRINDPVELLRPDMLVKVQFYAQTAQTAHTEQDTADQTHSERLQYFIPDFSLKQQSGSASVWIVNEAQRLEKREIMVDGIQDNYLRISSGLRPGEWVVINPATELSAGQRVHVRETNNVATHLGGAQHD